MKYMQRSVMVLAILLLYTLSVAYAFQYFFTTEKQQISSGLILTSRTITVPDNYSTIQEAINNAGNGDTIFVRNGTYYEHLIVDKTLTLIGEDRNATVIDGGGIAPGEVVTIAADSVNISSFTVQHSRSGGSGIWIDGYNDTIVSGNMISNNGDGIRVLHSHDNTITKNIVKNNPNTGIGFDWSYNNIVCKNVATNNGIGIGEGYRPYNNTFSENTVSNNSYGFGLTGPSENGRFFRNSIINNTVQVSLFGYNTPNTWDNGFDGNYWSDYNGTDFNGDGIGDTPYIIDANNQDNYPLMSPYLYADVNHDTTVNMRDIGLTCDAFGSVPGSPNWNPHCDINEDNVVNMRDIGIACDNFMKRWE